MDRYQVVELKEKTKRGFVALLVDNRYPTKPIQWFATTDSAVSAAKAANYVAERSWQMSK